MRKTLALTLSAAGFGLLMAASPAAAVPATPGTVALGKTVAAESPVTDVHYRHYRRGGFSIYIGPRRYWGYRRHYYGYPRYGAYRGYSRPYGFGGIGRRWSLPYTDGYDRSRYYDRSGYYEPPRPPAPVSYEGDYY